MRIISKEEIQAVLKSANYFDLIQDQEAGFIAYSKGKTCIPEVGHLYFSNPPGDCHIKYGYIQGEETFSIKVATGFYENHLKGLPNGNGLIMVFNQATGMPQAILLDEGILTDLRTAIAGAISAKYLAPKAVTCIGIIGTGTQAKLQLEWLSWMTGCQRAMIYGRTPERISNFCKAVPESLEVIPSSSVQELTENCELIVCATASKSPVLFETDIKPGTHIIAVGADGNGKQELDPEIFNKADICSVDSLSQCFAFGDSSFSTLKHKDFIELGHIIESPNLGRSSKKQITVSDLTGVSVQDIQIAQSVLKAL
jgi:ornithine cyclodeaminase